MSTEDLRALLDPLLAVKAARPVVRTVETPDGAEHQVAAVMPEQLPEVAVIPNPDQGPGINLGAQVALLQSALGRLADMQLRGVHGQQVYASTLIWQAGDTRDIPIAWSSTPLAPCRHAVPRLDVGVAWIGKLSASIAPGSVTDTGCTVTIRATSAVGVTAAQPLTVHADGTYLYWPEFKE